MWQQSCPLSWRCEHNFAHIYNKRDFFAQTEQQQKKRYEKISHKKKPGKQRKFLITVSQLPPSCYNNQILFYWVPTCLFFCSFHNRYTFFKNVFSLQTISAHTHKHGNKLMQICLIALTSSLRLYSCFISEEVRKFWRDKPMS